MSVHDAGRFARAWLSVGVASVTDDNHPALDRTMCVELFPEGVRLVATDSYMVLTAWVPAEDGDDAPEPGIDDAPVSVAVAIDEHRRGAGLCKHLLKLSRNEDITKQPGCVSLHFGGDPRRRTDQRLEGFEPTFLMIDHPDHERVILQLFEGAYPDWRPLVSSFRAARTDVVALMPDRLDQIAKLAKINNAPIRWRFGGAEKAAHISVLSGLGDDGLAVTGLVMPARVEWGSGERAPEEAA